MLNVNYMTIIKPKKFNQTETQQNNYLTYMLRKKINSIKHD